MQLQLNNPELVAKIEQSVAQTGPSAEEVIEEAVAGYFDEQAQIRETRGCVSS